MTHAVTIYSSTTPHGISVRCGSGRYDNAAMWNTVTNLIRIMNAIITVLGTCDDEYYVTSDDCLYILKR